VRTAIIRYAPRAVGVNPSASQGEARLRGLWRIISSKTISPRLNPPTPRVRGAWGEARLRGRERNNDSKTVFLTRWNRSCPCTAWERGRLARMPGTRASCPTWERGRLARMPGTRASCLAWERGRLARMPGSAGILPHLGARASRPHARDAGIPPRLGARASCPPGSAGILPRLGSRASRPHWERGHLALDAPRGRDVLALQGQVFWEAPAFPISFWASGRPNSPFFPRGRRGLGG